MLNVKDLNTLKNTSLFKDYDIDELSKILTQVKYEIINYPKDNIVFMENEECNTLHIILKGNIKIQRTDSLGQTLTITEFGEDEIIGESLLFLEDNRYPMSGIATETTRILYLPKKTVLHLCQINENFLFQFLKFLSEKSSTLSSKIKIISLKNIRHKISKFLLIQYNKSKTKSIELNMTKEEWANLLGVQRPSLSRELIRMKEDGLIDYDYNFVYIEDVNKLKNIIQQ